MDHVDNTSPNSSFVYSLPQEYAYLGVTLQRLPLVAPLFLLGEGGTGWSLKRAFICWIKKESRIKLPISWRQLYRLSIATGTGLNCRHSILRGYRVFLFVVISRRLSGSRVICLMDAPCYFWGMVTQVRSFTFIYLGAEVNNTLKIHVLQTESSYGHYMSSFFAVRLVCFFSQAWMWY